MTYTTTGNSQSSLTAYHEQDGAVIRIVLNGQNIQLNLEQREKLAAYLLKENN